MMPPEGGRCLRRGPGCWFRPGPHTPAQRVGPTCAPLVPQVGHASSRRDTRAAGWPGQRRTDHPAHRPGCPVSGGQPHGTRGRLGDGSSTQQGVALLSPGSSNSGVSKNQHHQKEDAEEER